MNPDLNKIQDQINKLQRDLDNLRSTTTIPYDINSAFYDRLGIERITNKLSTKTAASETQAVNEAGTNTYSVAKPMDGFEQRVVNGSIRYYPYYT